MVEAAGAARRPLWRHYLFLPSGWIPPLDLPVLCKIASTIVLSVFLAAQVCIDLGKILGDVYILWATPTAAGPSLCAEGAGFSAGATL